MCMLAEETNFLLMEGEEWLGKHYSGTARATSGPVLNLLMPFTFATAWELPLTPIEIYWRWEEETLFR